MLTIAVAKGRIFADALPLLAQADIVPLDDPKTCRKLIIATINPQVRLIVIRPADVPTFVEYGAADVGIVGKDVLLEYDGGNLYEPLDLGIGKCRLMTATPKDCPDLPARLKVASKYVKTTQQYFADKGIQASVIKLYGAMELAPMVGLADCIVDIVDTGNTLRANGLQPQELIMPITSRLIVNQTAMKIKRQVVQSLIDQLSKAVKCPN